MILVGTTAVIALALLVVCINIVFFVYVNKKRESASRLLYELEQRRALQEREMENERKESLLKLKNELHKRRVEFEANLKKERAEVDRLREKIDKRYESLRNDETQFEELKRELREREREISRTSDMIRAQEEKLQKVHVNLMTQLERIATMSQDEARQTLMNLLHEEAKHSSSKWIQKIEDEARDTAKDRARKIVLDVMQRYTAEHVNAHSAGVVQLPNDDMKGRIIGKEGRNIKALEMATGVEFVIGETPEIITISSFNPIRREVARRSLERLVADGRINPTKIEEIVQLCEREIEEIIQEKGRDAILQCNVQGVKPEIVTLLGKLHFRTSYSQNVLTHSIEVARLSQAIANEIGLEHPEWALRAGLFHDMGKALSIECEGPHAQIGADVARRCGENPIIVNAIAAHHEEVPFKSLYDVVIVIADTISASRPGARRETLSAYLKRLEKLEEVAKTFSGVRKAYALQAGREIRVMVEEDVVNDDAAVVLARDIARRVEEDIAFPGQIKVHVIREKRAIEYAR